MSEINNYDPNPYDDVTIEEALVQIYDRVNDRTIRQIVTILKKVIDGISTGDISRYTVEKTTAESGEVTYKLMQQINNGTPTPVGDTVGLRGSQILANYDEELQILDNIISIIKVALDGKADITDIPTVPIMAVQKNGTGITPVDGTVNITVPIVAADVAALPDTTRYAAALSLTIDSATFVVTGQLKDQNGDNLGTTQTIDLPLESVVVGGSYNSQTQKVVLTLQNGNTIEFSVADLVYGLQTELSETNKLNPAYINYDSTHRAVSDAEKSAWNAKQDALTTAQLAAVNSGITSEDVTQIETNKTNILLKANTSDVNTATTNLQNQIDQIVISASAEAVVAPEVAAARVDVEGISYTTLKDRLDKSQEEFYEFEDTTFVKIKSSNLFNKNSELIKSNYVVQGSGDYFALSGSSVSHPIWVETGKTYKFPVLSTYYGQNAGVVRSCDENGNLLTGSTFATISDGIGTFTSNENKYVCVNVRSNTLSTFMFVEGDTYPSEYKPFVEPHYELLETALPDSAKSDSLNPLYNKKLAINGDSIAYGAGYTGGYGAMIAENNSMQLSNNARAGATIATGTLQDGNPRAYICETIQNMPLDADYYILEGGTNDIALSVPLGELTSGYTETLDTTTFYGAMESLCKQMITLFNGKKYGFLIVHQMKGGMRITSDKYTAIIECCEKYGVPYLDLAKNCVPFGLFEKDWNNSLSDLRNTYTADDGTGHGDGWHPNELGYRKYYVDRITSWLCEL